MPRRRAVITGLGVLSPVGHGREAFHAAALAGTPGVRVVANFDSSGLPHRCGGEIVNFDPKQFIPAANKDGRKSLKVMARTVQLGVCAASQAMETAKLAKGQVDPFRFGIEFGCVMVATELEDLVAAAKTCTRTPTGAVDMAMWGTHGLEQVPPLWMLKYLPNMPACHTSIFFDAQGPNNTITEGDAAGLLALGEAYRTLDRGLADVMLVGGCESKVNPLSLCRHNLFTPFTKRNDAPGTAVRPFDGSRDGTALGEAAAVLTLEDLPFALARGANVLGELAGFASGFDRGRKGPVLAGVIRNAMREAGITPADVDHVNAAAAGSPVLDAFEARAIHEVFGTGTPVYALKGQTGNTGAAGGLLEMAVSLAALAGGGLPGTVNYAEPDPACPVTVYTGGPRPCTKPYAVKISLTDHGQCAAAVVRKWEGA